MNKITDERTMKMKGLVKYLKDVQEELMDAVLYIQTARDELQDLHEESLIEKFNEDEHEELSLSEIPQDEGYEEI